MIVGKWLEKLEKEQIDGTKDILDNIQKIFDVLVASETSKLPLDMYGKVYGELFNLRGKTALTTVADKTIQKIENLMTQFIAPLFDEIQDKNTETIVDMIIKSWTIATKLEQWLSKIFNNLNLDQNPCKSVLFLYKTVIGKYQTFLISIITTYVCEEHEKQPKEDKIPKPTAESTEGQPSGNSFLAQISNFNKNKLKKVEYAFPPKCQQLIKFIFDLEFNLVEFENEDFVKITMSYFRNLQDEKIRLENTKKTTHESVGATTGVTRRWKVNDHFAEDDTTHIENLKFYRGEIALNGEQNGEKITQIHKKWFGKYDKMEIKHDYIQWLFPIRESGLNGRAQSITKHEAETFRNSPELLSRIVDSYELILDFFGVMLLNKKTGKMARDPLVWSGRSHNLNTSPHNYLRITRIMKCLGIVGLEHLKLPFIKFMIVEVLQNRSLERGKESLLKYWIPTLRKESELQEAENLVEKMTGKKINRRMYDWEPENWSVQRVEDIPVRKDESSDSDYEDSNSQRIGGHLHTPFDWKLREEQEEIERSARESKISKDQALLDACLD